MGQRSGTHVGHTHHLQHPGHMGVTGLSLDTIGKVEYHTRTLALQRPRHEFFQLVYQVLVTL